MFRLILRGILLLSSIAVISLMAATTLGITLDHTILSAVTLDDYSNTNLHTHYLIDVDRGMNIGFQIPVPGNNQTSLTNWGRTNVTGFLVATSRIMNPDEGRLSKRITHYRVSEYDFDTRELVPYFSYTERWQTRSSNNVEHLSSNLFRISYQATEESGVEDRIAIYHALLNKLFIYAPEDNLRHIATIPIDASTATGNPTLSPSPDGNQFALRYQSGVLLIINADGTNRRYFQVDDYEHFEAIWSQDGREILINQFTDSGLAPLKILDVESGQWRADVERIIGRLPRWMCNDKWLLYETTPANELHRQFHILEASSGRIFHLNSDAIVQNNEVIGSIWSPDCTHLAILTRSAVPNAQHSRSTLYFASIDFNDITLIAESIIPGYFFSSDGTYVTYATEFDSNSYAVYQQQIDGSGPHERVGYFPNNVYFIREYFDGGRRATFLRTQTIVPPPGSSTQPHNRQQIYIVDSTNGTAYRTFDTDDIIWSFSLLHNE